jgi:hypothetical protein
MSRPISQALPWLAVLASAMLLAVALWQIADIPGFADAAEGCDAFGYQRQAALFRSHGLQGLDTRLETPSSRRLIDGMLKSGQPAGDWYQAVAPHCHHYKAAPDRVVMQYPPGTGLLLTAFPEAIQSRGLLIAGILGIAAAFAGLGAASRSLAGIAGSLAAGTLVIAATRAGAGSDSVAPATLLAVLAGILLAPGIASRRAMLLTLFGALVGLSAAVRVADLLLAFGPGALAAWLLVARRGAAEAKRAAGLAAGLLVGVVPLLAANLVNTGSPLSTTYSPIDASAPRVGWSAVSRGLQFYFVPTASGLVLAGSLLLAGLALCRRPRSAVAAALISMLASLAYLVPKQVLIVYYLTPVAAFLMATTVAAMARPRHGSARWPIVIATALPLVGGALWAGSRDFPQRDEAISAPVAAVLAQDPIIWSDGLGGMFVLHGGAYAAKLAFTSEANQDRLLDIAQRAGIPQLITLESDTMRSIAARLQARWTLTPLGPAYGAEVYSLSPRPAE